VIDPKRREMFADLYRVAEYYENPPFIPGNPEWNAHWFNTAMSESLTPFLEKHQGQLAADLAWAIVEEADRKAVEMNKQLK
jgi:hypothetical protein